MAYELLNRLSPSEADQVLSLGKKIKVPSGTSLFRLGDPADHLFLVDHGEIRLTLPMQVHGREQDVLIEEKSPGETVGWSALIPPHRFTLSANASVDSQVIALTREELQSYFDTSPAVGQKIALNLAIVVGHRLQLVQAMWLREMQRAVDLRSAQVAQAR